MATALKRCGCSKSKQAALLTSLSDGVRKPTYMCLRSMLSEAQRAGRISGHRLGGIHVAASQPRNFVFSTHAEFTKLVSHLPAAMQAAVWVMRGDGAAARRSCTGAPGQLLCLALGHVEFVVAVAIVNAGDVG